MNGLVVIRDGQPVGGENLFRVLGNTARAQLEFNEQPPTAADDDPRWAFWAISSQLQPTALSAVAQGRPP